MGEDVVAAAQVEHARDLFPLREVHHVEQHIPFTIAIAEADDAERERRRKALREPYRTLLGHFRHEIAHYCWDRLVRDAPALGPCRATFGDERASYKDALKRHYREGPPEDWRERFVSAYAATHPWEDFAETFAHYLHILDTLDTAGAFGVAIRPREVAQADALAVEVDFRTEDVDGIALLVKAWLPLTFALNSLNRSMGLGDLYPFVLNPAIVGKLGFIHDLSAARSGADVRSSRASGLSRPCRRTLLRGRRPRSRSETRLPIALDGARPRRATLPSRTAGTHRQGSAVS